jgi:tetratricopeptide (TPR) repeat protein
LLGDDVAERDAPRAAQRETRLANRALLLGNVAEAQAAYCRAFEWDRTNVDRHVNLARLFLVRRDWEKAAEYGQSALDLDPKSRPALGVVGDAWAALHRTEEARAAWLAAEKKPNASAGELRLIVRRNMALAKRVERLKDYTLGERIYRRVLLFSPEHTGAMKGIASCLRKVGDPRAAEAWASRAQVLNR